MFYKKYMDVNRISLDMELFYCKRLYGNKYKSTYLWVDHC